MSTGSDMYKVYLHEVHAFLSYEHQYQNRPKCRGINMFRSCNLILQQTCLFDVFHVLPTKMLHLLYLMKPAFSEMDGVSTRKFKEYSRCSMYDRLDWRLQMMPRVLEIYMFPFSSQDFQGCRWLLQNSEFGVRARWQTGPTQCHWEVLLAQRSSSMLDPNAAFLEVVQGCGDLSLDIKNHLTHAWPFWTTLDSASRERSIQQLCL